MNATPSETFFRDSDDSSFDFVERRARHEEFETLVMWRAMQSDLDAYAVPRTHFVVDIVDIVENLSLNTAQRA